MSEEKEEKSEPFPAEVPGANVETPKEEERLLQEVAEYRDKYLRMLAEMENQRKRLQKEKTEAVKYAVSEVVVDFLQPLDNLENALKYALQMSDEVKQWAQGFQMILQQFKEALTQNGVQPFESIGKPFDHDHHEAIEAVESSEAAPGTVIEELSRGYKIDGRTVRPARVKVAKSPLTNNE